MIGVEFRFLVARIDDEMAGIPTAGFRGLTVCRRKKSEPTDDKRRAKRI